MTLSLDTLKSAVAGTAAAFRCVTDYQPAGGPGDKIFPATYEKGEYAIETRLIDGADVQCVLLDSVQSQANRMEEALFDAWERKRIRLPVITVDFQSPDLLKPFRVTSLDAPHRIADALLRDSLFDGKRFRESAIGHQLDHVDIRHATAPFELCPTALIFGLWDSTGPRGGAGAKFERAIVSEIVGIDVRVGRRTSSRIDPAQILVDAGPLYQTSDGGWTLTEQKAAQDKKGALKLGKDGRPSEANHGNITPSIVDGGVTLGRARQTTVLSLTGLRRLRFPMNGQSPSDPAVDDVARAALAALAICGASLAREKGADLRSRCQLHATAPFVWEMLDTPGAPPQVFTLPATEAITLYQQAVIEVKGAGLPWREDEVILQPSGSLVELVARSQRLAAAGGLVGAV
jgi:CRISPR-associated protein Csb1